MDSESRRLTEDELHKVLARATELRPEIESGLTVAELHEVAQEVGIPSEALSEALREVSRSAAAESLSVRRWTRQHHTAFVSVTVSDTELAFLLRLLDRLGQIRGEVSYAEGAVRWKSPDGHLVEVLCRPSETQVTVEANEEPRVIEVLAGAGWTFLLATVAGRLFPQELLPLLVGAGAGFASCAAYLKYRAIKVRETATKTVAGIGDALRLVAGDENRK